MRFGEFDTTTRRSGFRYFRSFRRRRARAVPAAASWLAPLLNRHPRQTSDWQRDIAMFAAVRPDSRIWCDGPTVPDEEDHSHLVLVLPLWGLCRQRPRGGRHIEGVQRVAPGFLAVGRIDPFHHPRELIEPLVEFLTQFDVAIANR